MVNTLTRTTQDDVLGFLFDQPSAEPRTWTITASLIAARREFDGRITLAVADPDGRPNRMLLAFPGPHEAIASHPAFGRCIEQSRSAFIQDFVNPSEEGFDLLYGKARLTLALEAAVTGPARCMPRIVGFTALGGA